MENQDLLMLFNQELKPELESIETQRKTIKRLIGVLIAGLVLAKITYESIRNDYVAWPVAIGLALIGLVMGAKAMLKYFKYRSIFKKEVVTKIVHFINPYYVYDHKRHINASDVIKSNLFGEKIDRCQGDDFVSGIIDKTDFQFSEIHPQYKRVTTEDGQRKTEWITIFNGLFFMADFNKHLNAETYVLPDKTEKRLGQWIRKFQKNSDFGTLVKLEDPTFESEFKVFSSSQQEARYVLTPTMMQAIVRIRQTLKEDFRFSFIGNRVYCAVGFKKGLFEPRIRKSGVNFRDVEFMHQLFSLIELIIQEMNLNTRIWTKE
ncbi:DUF3137 domain-containing protein [Carboxylicivirga caseinilyticus]|uniref:DUF3137 domain-containing protein n=1 Tax=Carboxylicivirga caseinilyticus TaxID=3417572 RepID=UPI003D355CD4|nr:DUF3137 domain-containing protein [Marinilabiliaceae bacterium A049]